MLPLDLREGSGTLACRIDVSAVSLNPQTGIVRNRRKSEECEKRTENWIYTCTMLGKYGGAHEASEYRKFVHLPQRRCPRLPKI